MLINEVTKEEELVTDTKVKEANVKFAADTRLHVDCIEKLWLMGEAEEVFWRRSYLGTVHALLAPYVPKVIVR